MADKDFKIKTGLDLPAPLPFSQGGTGQATANNALNAILPIQTSAAGQYLTTNGTDTLWSTVSAGVSTAGGSIITVPSGTTIPLTIQNNGTGNSFVVNDVASDTTPFVVDAGGFVGIGSTVPAAPLHINQLGGIRLSDITNAFYFDIFRDGGDGLLQINGNQGNGYKWLNAGVERMRIDSVGQIGINTTSPLAQLHIVSSSGGNEGLIIQPNATALTATITNAVQSNGTVTYTASNTFTAGQQVTITGITPTTYNISNATIKTRTASSFTVVSSSLGGIYASGGTATVYAPLQDWQTSAGISQLAINQAGYATTINTELVMEQTGDTFGTSRLRLQNRNGQNGPLFDTSSSTVDLVDFGFKSITAQGNIRYEARYAASGNTTTTGPEFQIGNTVGIVTGSAATLNQTLFPLIVGTSLLDRRVQIHSTTGNTVPLTIKAMPTLTATITGATVTTFANKSGTLIVPQGAAVTFSRITGIASTTGLIAGMRLTYVSGSNNFGAGGTATIISVDSSTSLSVYTSGSAVGGSVTFSIQNSVQYNATHTFAQTHSVTITGALAAGLNVTNATIGAISGGNSFTVINTTASGTWSSGGTATVTQSANLTNWIGSSGSTLVAIDSTGNFGIGTVSPSAKLDVRSEAGSAVQFNLYTGSAAAAAILSIGQVGAIAWDAVVSTTTGDFNIGVNGGGTAYNIVRSGTAISYQSWSTNGTERMRIDNAGNTTINTIADGTLSTASVGGGFMGLPQIPGTTLADTTVPADAGKHFYSTATRTVTIDSNLNSALPIGTTFTFVSGPGATTTIAITADTMYLVGNGATGSRTLAPYGMASAVKVASNIWFISGNGLS